MRAAVLHSADGVPRCESFPEPRAEQGEEAIEVYAAGLHPVVKALATGRHYGSTNELPLIPGIDGVGRLSDGTRVYFGRSRHPYGTLAERCLASPQFCIPLPKELDDETAAAIINPGMSGWLALRSRAQLRRGENVLVLGATGVAGQLAIQLARELGADRIVAAGRNREMLEKLKEVGADSLIPLGQAREALLQSFATEIQDSGIQVVLDFLWGEPAEIFFEAVGGRNFLSRAPRLRFLQIGESAGAKISLSASSLRSSGVEVLGSGGGSISYAEILREIPSFLSLAAEKQLFLSIQKVPLRDIHQVWEQERAGSRIVIQCRA